MFKKSAFFHQINDISIIKFKNLLWMFHKKSPASLSCKLLIYKSMVKLIWTYDIQLQGSVKPSNTNLLQQSHSELYIGCLPSVKAWR